MYGYRYDTETGLYYLNSRYYNPEWGRFINADALVGKTGELLSHNMFAYCSNNPINREDATGYMYRSINDTLGGGEAIILIAILTAIIATKPQPTTSTSVAYPAINLPQFSKSKTNTKVKTQTGTKVANPPNSKSDYWEADYDDKKNIVDWNPAAPITFEAAYIRVLEGKSIMCADYNKARQMAMKFPGSHIPEVDKGKFLNSAYYPHFHINFGHGDPHIWYQN